MKLSAYLHKHKLSPQQFGEMIGTSRQAVEHWAAGDRFPRLGSMRKIVKATHGEVTAADLLKGARK